MSTYRLDVPELYRRLDAQRTARGMSWRDLAEETGISASGFTRIGHGRAPDAHALVTLLVWLDADDDIAYLIRPDAPD